MMKKPPTQGSTFVGLIPCAVQPTSLVNITIRSPASNLCTESCFSGTVHYRCRGHLLSLRSGSHFQEVSSLLLWPTSYGSSVKTIAQTDNYIHIQRTSAYIWRCQFDKRIMLHTIHSQFYHHLSETFVSISTSLLNLRLTWMLYLRRCSHWSLLQAIVWDCLCTYRWTDECRIQ